MTTVDGLITTWLAGHDSDRTREVIDLLLSYLAKLAVPNANGANPGQPAGREVDVAREQDASRGDPVWICSGSSATVVASITPRPVVRMRT